MLEVGYLLDSESFSMFSTFWLAGVIGFLKNPRALNPKPYDPKP